MYTEYIIVNFCEPLVLINDSSVCWYEKLLLVNSQIETMKQRLRLFLMHFMN